MFIRNFVPQLTLGKTALGIVKANAIICKFKPDVVIGTGGYVCGPVLMAAALHNIPTLIQEQNVIAGITNKILSRFVDVVALGYKDAEASFSKAKRVVYTGNPVRPDVLVDSRTAGRNYFNLSDDTFTVLIAGGSRGARTINKRHGLQRGRSGPAMRLTGDSPGADRR